MGIVLPILPSVSIARRMRRVLLLQIFFVFSLYMLLFTIINSVLNFEASLTHNLSSNYRLTSILQDIDDAAEDAYQMVVSGQPTSEVDHRLRQLFGRIDALQQTQTVIIAPDQSYVDLAVRVGRVRADAHQFVRTVNGSKTELGQVFQSFTGSIRSVRVGLDSITSRYQSELLESLGRRNALLGLQAIVVVASLIAIGYGYIAPAFQRVLARLANQNRELKVLDQTKMEFLSIASHQLKTPLSGLKWNLALLYRLRRTLPERDGRYLVQAREHTEAMVRLVSNFLNVSRIEQGRIEVDIAPTDIVPIVKAVLRVNRRLATSYRVTLNLDLDRPKAVAKVDPLLLKQVVQNLVDNAILYNRPGGSVTVGVKHLSDSIKLTVSDTGMGMSEHDLSRVFNQFFRGENAKTMRPDGSGLGLYFVKKIIQKLDGTIACTSTLNRGTEFAIKLKRQ